MSTSSAVPTSEDVDKNRMTDEGIDVQSVVGDITTQVDPHEGREPLGGRVIPESELTYDEDGLPIITDHDLEITGRTLQLFYRFPEAALGNRFIKHTREYNLRQNIRINAMRWLKPGNVPSVKEILKAKHTNELEVLHSSGIRLNRNRKKRLLPNQIGQVIIEDENENTPQLTLELSSDLVLCNTTNKENISQDSNGYNVPLKDTSSIKACKRSDLSENFRVHPAADAAPLSGSNGIKILDPSITAEFPTIPSHHTATSSTVQLEVVDDDNVEILEQTTKKIKLNNSSVKPVVFSRPKHVTNYSEENPQPRGNVVRPSAEDLAPTPGVLSVLDVTNPPNLSTSTNVKINPNEASDYLKIDMPVGLQTQDEVSKISQRYARSFTGNSSILAVDGVTVVSTPHATIVDDEEAAVDQIDESLQDGMSRNNKIVKIGKQEKQKWSSKEGLYGDSIRIIDDELIKDEEVERKLSATCQMAEEEAKNVEREDGRPRALKNPIPCYVCKTHFKVLHHFYDRLCPTCAEFNYKKRFQTADMVIRRKNQVTNEVTTTRRICLVTGARVKIGYEIALKLLRAGAFVIATSRFANDTAMRFYKEDDFNEWKDRLHIYSLDFRVISAVEMFALHILKTYPRLDLLMNNAAQTIRRPPQFYRHLLGIERTPIEALPEAVQPLIQDFLSPTFRKTSKTVSMNLLRSFGFNSTKELLTMEPTKSENQESMDNVETTSTALQSYNDPGSMSTRLVTMLSLPSAAAINPAELTQLALVEGDEDKPEDAKLFPVGLLDKDDQQVDLRDKQTWVMQADEISTVELAEVQLINSMAPFILNTKLKPLMRKTGDASWIINVTSMEGKFRGFKDTTHPHTNMAKAALNMFTHTSARDYAVDKIFMNSVDTGWITEELPHAVAVHKANIGFAPPLDENDGASRCLDPVFTSLLTGVYEYGKFFKDYGEGHW